MPSAGQVRLPTSRSDATAAADWIERFFDEPPNWAIALATAFRKAADRKRSGARFTMLIDAEVARHFGRLRETAIVTNGAPPAVIQMMVVCKGRKGRRPLSRTEREQREAGSIHKEDRHRKRVSREARYERSVDAWMSEHGSLLGAVGTKAEKAFPKK